MVSVFQRPAFPSRFVARAAGPLVVTLGLFGVAACGGDAADDSGAGGSITGSGGSGSSAVGGSSGASGAGAGGNVAGTGAGAGAGGASASCPPEGPYGTSPGQVAPDVTLYDCDGNPVDLHGLCEREGAFVYTFAGWCPTCKAYASSDKPNEIWNKYREQSFDMYFVVTAPASYDVAPTQDTCAAYRDQYGLKMKVLFDPDGVTTSKLNMKINSGDLVLTRGAVIDINTADHAAVDSALAEIFGF